MTRPELKENETKNEEEKIEKVFYERRMGKQITKQIVNDRGRVGCRSLIVNGKALKTLTATISSNEDIFCYELE